MPNSTAVPAICPATRVRTVSPTAAAAGPGSRSIWSMRNRCARKPPGSAAAVPSASATATTLAPSRRCASDCPTVPQNGHAVAGVVADAAITSTPVRIVVTDGRALWITDSLARASGLHGSPPASKPAAQAREMQEPGRRVPNTPAPGLIPYPSPRVPSASAPSSREPCTRAACPCPCRRRPASAPRASS